MTTLYVTMGLPASGKSTWAKSVDALRWNNDDMRKMMTGASFVKKIDGFINTARDTFVASALAGGKDVVVDNTNLNPIHSRKLARIAQEHHATFSIKVFDAPVSVCVDRDMRRQNPVGERVIVDMFLQYGGEYNWMRW